MPIAVVLVPLWNQGEIAGKPKPIPKISKIRDREAAAAAPAKIEAHDTPDAVVSDDTSKKVCSVIVIIISIFY
jgi:hypothetical protein